MTMIKVDDPLWYLSKPDYDLQVYCTTSGSLYMDVQNNKKGCYISWSQGKEVFDAYMGLRKQLEEL
jgi:hypothetical protein